MPPSPLSSAGHRVTVLWSLYRPLMRFGSLHGGPVMLDHVRRTFRKSQGWTSVQRIKRELTDMYNLLDDLQAASRGSVKASQAIKHLVAYISSTKKRAPVAATAEAAKTPPRRTPGILHAQLMHPPLPRLKPQPLALSLMIFKRRKAIQNRADRASLGKSMVQLGKEESRFERDLGLPIGLGSEKYASEWVRDLATISENVKVEYARKDTRCRFWLETMITTREAAIGDIIRLAEIHCTSFGPSTLFQRLFGQVPEDEMAAHLQQRMRGWFSNPKCAVWTAVDVQGKIVAYAMWDRPAPERGWPSDVPNVERPRSFPAGADQELALDFFTRLDAHGRSIVGRHWHLQILATDPACQGQGAGTRLLQDGMRRAEDEGLPIYLDSTEAGKPLYVKYGFVESAGPISLKDGSTSVQPMVWRAGQKEVSSA
ncbi:hypothetical protein ACM66B_006713 [Microbotryomycetes sp. NB124-2]